MGVVIAGWMLAALGTYLAAGVLFAIPFVLVGAGRIDPGARGAPWSFRLLIVPGVAALWPLLLRRWASGATHPPEERTAHRRAARRVRS